MVDNTNMEYSRSIKLEDIIADPKKRAGWKKIEITATNEVGDPFTEVTYNEDKAETHYFKVNPGPSAKLVVDGDFSSGASSVPVVIHVKDLTETTVKALAGCSACKAVNLKTMEYKIETTHNGVTNESEYRKLGAKQIRITSEGKNTVTLWLVDDDEEGNLEFKIPVTFTIDYNQRRN